VRVPSSDTRNGAGPERSKPLLQKMWKLVVLALALSACGTPDGRPVLISTPDPPPPDPAPPSLAAQLPAWQLNAPISRAVAAVSGRRLIIAGGLTPSGSSANQVWSLDPKSGVEVPLGALPVPVHDAGGVWRNGRLLVFGGGSTSSLAVVQAAGGRFGGVVGSLPQARSDLTAVTMGRQTYILGGYDGIRLSGDVLQTADGIHFSVVAHLRVPVRYAAAAGIGGKIFVFGGQGAAGGPVSAIQEIDPGRGAVAIVGHLPLRLAHASAFHLGNHLYVAGGRSGLAAQRRIWSFDPARKRVRLAGWLPIALSDMAAVTLGRSAYLIGGENWAPQPSVVELHPRSGEAAARVPDDFPFHGRLLIADRGNDRLLLVNRAKQVLWTYPSRGKAPPVGGFYFPDDAFFADHGTRIVVNQEANDTIVQIGFPSGRVLWSYGVPGVAGSAPGYLQEPDDAYLLRNGEVVVADIQNCRVLFIKPNHQIAGQIGTTGDCVHSPPSALASPNGDTPLADGNILISEINGSWISEYTPGGRLVWTTQLPISYPSDPQQIGPDRYLVCDYSRPGGLYEFNRSGRVLWSYHVTSGNGMLDHPSLSERLPNGFLMVNDDYRHRMVVINPVTKTIVWQYGHTGTPGTRPGYLNTPDGFDVVTANGATPTHPHTR